MEILIIDSDGTPLIDPPTDFIDAIIQGKGGIIKIDPDCPPPKVLWTLKALLQSIGIGFQWGTIKNLTDAGMHGEQAEAYVTSMINTLVQTEIPALPSEADIEDIRKGFLRSQAAIDEIEPDVEAPSDDG